MSLNKMLRVKDTGIYHAERQFCSVAEFSLKEMDRPYDLEFRRSKQYELQLVIGTSFISNNVEMPIQQERAEKQLRHELYSDVIGELHALSNMSDQPQVKLKIDQIINELMECSL